ncbi:hypothetical protein CEUSTIGMA_g5462.t1 [Chlamydomonas eustigma]|uniref:Acyltransferase n=1 Tax=Chlamydomonas eustigma TaxID=1157962 RepID=A0A250X5I5_9CHLO|nr:hypothetical protein CEUSTIGMA_g5462.t1 [Chlamydomonas eustigma]|eukprot:GAX78020.1 hypothetical protein CEUSTIGMA_g5462.t1 [Chlamydomonas eustigma]
MDGGCAKKMHGSDKELIRQRLVVLFFCWSVMGIIWSWLTILIVVRIHVAVAAVLVIYLSYAWTIGFKEAETFGDDPVIRRWKIWNNMKDYFTAKLHKTVDLDPKKNYIFAMSPHGITACSAWINFATEATGFSELFPGIQLRCLTLDANFLAPVIREYCLMCGLRSAGRRSIRTILSSGFGNSVFLVPGGAAEALLAAPGTCDVLLAKRKGFVKMAIETGSSLVPVVAFGENDTFDTFIPDQGSVSDKVMKMLKKFLGFATPIFWGVGITSGWGLLPKGVPLNTVVGEPIAVPLYQGQGSSDERMIALVDEVHGKFLAATQKLWDEYKDKFASDRRRELRFVTK